METSQVKKIQCQNCHKTFSVSEADLKFYKRVQVPEPTHCPDCRNQRRLVLRNELNLYQDKCDLCGKSIISLYSPDKPYKIYCYDCFYSDKWDPLKYGREYDFNQPFFKQFRELQLKVPRIFGFNIRNENSEYTNGSAYNKDCYLIFVSDHNENCLYCYSIFECKDSLDCYNSYKLESCYECSGCNNCYDCRNVWDSADCHELSWCIDCKGCANCFGCVGLRNQNYYFLNKQISSEEYQKKIKNISEKDLQEFEKLKLKHSFKYIHGLKNENSTGDYINNCKDCEACYDSHYLEKCKYITHGNKAKDSYDGYMVGDNTELCYESLGVLGLNDCLTTYFVINAYNAEYCDSCSASKNLFGCISLKNKEYCILNKQYSEKEFFQLKDKIVAQMIKDGEYGEFWPIENAPFAYNETAANDFYPMNKKDVLAKGWRWLEEEKKTVDPTLLVCQSCGKNFNIISREKKFYQDKNLPLPKSCFNCRHKARLALKNPRSLWKSRCMCTQPTHGHHGRCAQEFETTYSPERKELVYCEGCYNKEIY